MIKKMLLLSLVLLFAVSLSACGKKTPTPGASATIAPSSSSTEPVDSAAVEDTSVLAESVYKQNCISCHGVDLGGGVGPNIQQVGARLSVEQITTLLINGNGVMPSFKDLLKANEIAALSNWLAAKK